MGEYKYSQNREILLESKKIAETECIIFIDTWNTPK